MSGVAGNVWAGAASPPSPGCSDGGAADGDCHRTAGRALADTPRAREAAARRGRPHGQVLVARAAQGARRRRLSEARQEHDSAAQCYPVRRCSLQF